MAAKPNAKILTDITEIPYSDGKLHLVAVLDCFGGSIQGFHMNNSRRAELCVRALENVCRNTHANGAFSTPIGAASLPAKPSARTSSRRRLVQGMNCVRCCYDNARLKSFFGTLKKEKLYHMDTTMLRRDTVQCVCSAISATTTSNASLLLSAACPRWYSGETSLLQFSIMPHDMSLRRWHEKILAFLD